MKTIGNNPWGTTLVVPFLLCTFMYMKLHFTKYHGTGNDFVMVDDRSSRIRKKLDQKSIADICSRRFGVGADGMILLGKDRSSDFKMIYYNSDGRESSMCGNGGRCLVHFAHQLKVFKNECRFMAIDGVHEAHIDNKDKVHLKMSDTQLPQSINKDHFLDTGSPHYVKFVKKIEGLDVSSEGSKIRNGRRYKKEGVNVNFVKSIKNQIEVATFERGVEDETYSCGTGVVASAILAHYTKQTSSKSIKVLTKGGELKVKFKPSKEGYNDIWLIGPAVPVYSGIWNL